MESSLYKSAFEKGEARARKETLVKVIVRALTHKLGAPDPGLKERLLAVADVDTLDVWCDEAMSLADTKAAEGLAEKIRRAPAG